MKKWTFLVLFLIQILGVAAFESAWGEEKATGGDKAVAEESVSEEERGLGQDSSSQVRLDLLAGSNRFLDSTLSGLIGVDSALDLGINLRSTRFGDTDWVRGFGASATFRENSNNATTAALDFSNYSTGLRSRGFRADHRFNLASLWDGERRSDVSLGLETAVYEEDRQNTLRQNGFTLGYDQEMPDDLQVGISVISYWVPDRQRARVQALFQSFEASPLVRATGGLLKRSINAYAGMQISDPHYIEIAINRAEPLDDSVDPFTTPMLRWDWILGRSWSIGASVATTFQQGNQSSNNSTLGFTTAYQFD